MPKRCFTFSATSRPGPGSPPDAPPDPRTSSLLEQQRGEPVQALAHVTGVPEVGPHLGRSESVYIPSRRRQRQSRSKGFDRRQSGGVSDCAQKYTTGRAPEMGSHHEQEAIFGSRRSGRCAGGRGVDDERPGRRDSPRGRRARATSMPPPVAGPRFMTLLESPPPPPCTAPGPPRGPSRK